MRGRVLAYPLGVLGIVLSCVPPQLDRQTSRVRSDASSGPDGADAPGGSSGSGGVESTPGESGGGGAVASGGGDPGGATTTAKGGASAGAPSKGGSNAGGMPSGGALGSGGTSGSGGASVPDASPGDDDIPTDGLLLWLRADRGVTVKDGTVSGWADQGPLHTNATQDQVPLQPTLVNGINGRPSVFFDGVDDALQVPEGFADFTKGLTMFTAVNAKKTDICTGIFEASNGSEVDDISFDSNITGLFNFEVVDKNNERVPFPALSPQQFTVLAGRPADSATVRRNGLFGAVVNSFPLPAVVTRKAVFVGSTLYDRCTSFYGSIGEFILYASALEDSEVLFVEGYLRTKFGCCS